MFALLPSIGSLDRKADEKQSLTEILQTAHDVHHASTTLEALRRRIIPRRALATRDIRDDLSVQTKRCMCNGMRQQIK